MHAFPDLNPVDKAKKVEDLLINRWIKNGGDIWYGILGFSKMTRKQKLEAAQSWKREEDLETQANKELYRQRITDERRSIERPKGRPRVASVTWYEGVGGPRVFHCTCPEPPDLNDGFSTEDIPDSDIGGVPSTMELYLQIWAAWGKVKRSRSSGRKICISGVTVYPFNFPCPVIEMVSIMERDWYPTKK